MPSPRPLAAPRSSQLAWRRAALAVHLSLGLAGVSHAQSLVDLYQAAQGYDAAYLAARAQFEANLAKAEQAQAGLRPQAGLAADASWSRRDDLSNDRASSSNAQGVTLSASQPLYRPANSATAQQGQLSVDVAKAQLQSAEHDLIVRITQAYFDVLAAQDSLGSVQALKAAVTQQLAAAKRRFEVGSATIIDTREAQAQFDRVTAQEIAADNDLRVKKLALDQLVGQNAVNPKPLARTVALPSPAPADVNQWVSQATEQHPAVRQASTGLAVAQLETEKAQAANKPTVDLFGRYNMGRSPSTSVPGAYSRANTATVGVQFNMPLYTGGATQNRIKETLALEDKARNDIEAAKRNVAQATRSAYFGIISGLGQVKALEAAETSSQSAVDANKLGYDVGAGTSIDVLNAQSQLFQVKRDLAQARYNVLIAHLRLKQASGKLQADDLQAINQLLAK
jgi:outer membrane protein